MKLFKCKWDTRLPEAQYFYSYKKFTERTSCALE